MDEKQSMLTVIGMQTMQIAMLKGQLAASQAENEQLKAAAAQVQQSATVSE
jgi:hypothetical protein